MPTSGNSSCDSLSPRPPRRSGASRHEPGAVARSHGTVDTTRPRPRPNTLGALRAPEDKVVPERQAQAAACGSFHGKPAGSVTEISALEDKSVAEHLRNHGTRDATLSALEEHATPIDRAVSLAAAPALVALMALDTSEVGQEQWDRVCLLLARLIAEASDDPSTVYRAAFGGGRWEAQLRSEGNTLARALLKPEGELKLEDARSIANLYAYDSPTHVRGSSKVCSLPSSVSASRPTDWFRLWMLEDPLVSKCDSLATCSQIIADGLRCVHHAAGRS